MSVPRSRGPIDRAAAARAIDDFLRAVGLDPAHEPELRGTGARVADAFTDELCSGYGEDVDELVSENAIDGSTGIVIARGIDVATMCPHHLLPAIGFADIAFEPAQKLVGIGTVARVVHTFARRLILQETLGEEVVGSLARVLQPKWVACRLELTHACLAARGERQPRTKIETISLRGDITVAAAHGLLSPSPSPSPSPSTKKGHP